MNNINNISIKELPNDERPYERCMDFGAQALTDAELLAVILRTGTKKLNAVLTVLFTISI